MYYYDIANRKLILFFIFLWLRLLGLLQNTESILSMIPKLYEGDPLAMENKLADLVDTVSGVSSIVASGVSKLGLVEKNVQFLLYTKSNTVKPYILKVGDVENLNKSPFDSESETKIIIHGWQDSALNPISQCISRNYLKKKNYNVIIVNWALISLSEYTIAVQLARPVCYNISYIFQMLK